MAQLTSRPARPITGEQAKPERQPALWVKVVVYAFLAIFTITSIGPLIFTFVSSFKTMEDVLAFPPTLIPHPFVWSNYQLILGNPLFLRWLLNSLVYAAGATLLNMLFSAMAGYALGRMNFPGKSLIFTITLAVMMIPTAITLIPKFMVVNSLHLVNTYWALILPAMAQPFSVFIMIQFMRALPKELEESASIDGASRWRTFYQIILPQVKPALTAVIILTFQNSWNDFQWPLVALGTQNMYTLPLGLFFFKSTYYTEYNLLLAGSMFNTIPILILFFIFQRYFIEGAVASGVKG
ncbi:carbohydrate ABC transporter permease [Dictyobacter aurantiacus]|uniref:ABC transporter permease n=1 Tax=Dictyobacter aurantiacus TaxID=1936993 RepID=A0A401ZE01_9CHLR|nr:carbohydrate ABC transporter permease [Dictyobacter aurantiacus]GCE05066.1 ABC transporter permease [Dictyobacter aurantiacus]